MLRAEQLSPNQLSKISILSPVYRYVISFLRSSEGKVLYIMGRKGVGKTLNVLKAIYDLGLDNVAWILYDGEAKDIFMLNIKSMEMEGVGVGDVEGDILVVDNIHYMARGVYEGDIDSDVLSFIVRLIPNFRKRILVSEDPINYYAKILHMNDFMKILKVSGINLEHPSQESVITFPKRSLIEYSIMLREDYGIEVESELVSTLLYYSLPVPRYILMLYYDMKSFELLDNKKITLEGLARLIYIKDEVRRKRRIGNEVELIAVGDGMINNTVYYIADIADKGRLKKTSLPIEPTYPYEYNYIHIYRWGEPDILIPRETVNIFRHFYLKPRTVEELIGQNSQLKGIIYNVNLLADALNIPDIAVSHAASLMDELPMDELKGYSHVDIAASLLYVASNDLGYPINIKNVVEIANTRRRTVSKIAKKIYKLLNMRGMGDGLDKYIPPFTCYFDYETVRMARAFINKNKSVFTGSGGEGVFLSTMIYFYCKKTGESIEDVVRSRGIWEATTITLSTLYNYIEKISQIDG